MEKKRFKPGSENTQSIERSDKQRKSVSDFWAKKWKIMLDFGVINKEFSNLAAWNVLRGFNTAYISNIEVDQNAVFYKPGDQCHQSSLQFSVQSAASVTFEEHV